MMIHIKKTSLNRRTSEDRDDSPDGDSILLELLGNIILNDILASNEHVEGNGNSKDGVNQVADGRLNNSKGDKNGKSNRGDGERLLSRVHCRKKEN